MRVLLTGASGMVGRNILEHHSINEYTLLKPSSRELNLLDFSEVNDYLKINKPEFIIHAAGLVGGIQANMADPVGFLVKNLDMGRNLILGAKENNIYNLMNISSSCMYPRNGINPLKEELILTGQLEPTNEGYALAKIVSTKLCEYISSTDSRFNYKTVIPCNLFGRYDKFSPQNSHMLPAVIRKIHEAKFNGNRSVSIWGNGKSRREFMYAGDIADFIWYAIKNFKNMPQNVNVGLGYDYSIDDYYSIIAKVIGYDVDFEYDLTKPSGMKQKVVNISKLEAFGWTSQVSLEEGIKKTYEFFKSQN
ncbi:GDP-L-fucose synthase [Tamlana sp. 2201CG12-4]|uniref:GDP-L-fucose synthase family protein n=1 Tax=Tamlana sp. 2201CG12-4 TaxID=3112582 RepID=UPI002DBEB86C|nr:GDP-L-fucose synthase [Tamlana sp. 2201CG12-4]MEC3906296.1 GDP-L-fucose synthase [Tamlana sp. 2201CG12-4]